MRRLNVFLTILLFSILIFNLNFIYSQKKDDKNISKENISSVSNTNEVFPFSEPQIENAAPNTFKFILQTMLILIIFSAFLYLLFKFIVKKRGVEGTSSDLMRVMAYLPLGPNRFLQVIEIGTQMIVIGNTDSNINFITEITDKETINSLKVAVSKQQIAGPVSFKEQVQNLLNSVKSNVMGSGVESGVDFLKKQRDRLKKMNRGK